MNRPDADFIFPQQDAKEVLLSVLDTIVRNPGVFVHGPAGYDGGDQLVSRIVSDLVGAGYLDRENGEQFIEAGWRGIRAFRAAEKSWPSEEEAAMRRSPHPTIVPNKS